MSDPDPTEVRPTMSPPATPMATVGSDPHRRRRPAETLTVGRWAWSSTLTVIAVAATSRAAPSIVLSLRSRSAPLPSSVEEQHAGERAGDRPDHQPAGRCRCGPCPAAGDTDPPIGFITTDATMSLDTAASGSTLKSSTSIGVMSAPPPMPVRPTVKPDEQPAEGQREVELPSGDPNPDRLGGQRGDAGRGQRRRYGHRHGAHPR